MNDAAPRRPPPPRISVVVLTHNRREEVLLTLARLTALPEAPPIVLVDNASTDGTVAAVAAAFPRVEIVRSAINLGAAGRNLGVERVRTPYVAFSDDDTEWHAGALARAATLLDTFPGVGLLCARILVGPDAVEDPASLLMARSPLASHGLPGRAILGFMAGACVMRRDLFVLMGGYRREFFVGGEEALMAFDLAAARWLMLYCPELLVTHRPSVAREPVVRRWQLARNRIWVAWLRLSFSSALRETLAGLAMLARCGCLIEGARHTWRDGAFARAERRPVPFRVERDWLAVERVRKGVEVGERNAPDAGRNRAGKAPAQEVVPAAAPIAWSTLRQPGMGGGGESKLRAPGSPPPSGAERPGTDDDTRRPNPRP